MEEGQCSVCSKKGAKACSRCKVQLYCGKECQRKDWKTHKKVCSDVTQTTFIRENVLPPQGLEPSDPMNAMLEHMYSLNLGAGLGLGQAPQMPKFHDEYKKVYPRDGAFYTKLRDSWLMSRMYSKEMVLKELRMNEFDERIFQKRWGPCALSYEFAVFLSGNPKPGDIFYNKPSSAYGYLPGQEIYQSMRNSPVPQQTFEFGETYVAVGFVDLFPLVVGTIAAKDESPSGLDPMVFYGYDRSVIVITRNMVLYQMMKDSTCIDSILQVWFSTGWSKKTLEDFQLSCHKVLKNLDPKIPSYLPIKELLTHWMKTSVGMKSVQILWTQHVAQHMLDPIPNLRHEKDRVEYARYISTGHIFGRENGDYVYGNLTMFSLPDSFKGFKREEENFFAAIAMNQIEYKQSLLKSVTKKISDGVQKLMEYIKNGSVTCHFTAAEFSLENKEELARIKMLNAKAIDWSNVPDYLKHDDFFEMARACDGTSTLHSLHFMNWMYYVFGTCIIDYSDRAAEVYKELVIEREKDFRDAKGSRPYFRQDNYIEYYLNYSQHALGKRYVKNFIDFFFGGRNVTVGDLIFEDFNPFARSQDTYFISFEFRK